VPSFKITCGTLKVTVAGSVLGSISPMNEQVAANSNTLKGGLTCKSTTGVPSKTKYTNNKGEAKETRLTATVAEKEANACELIGTSEAATFALLPNKMIEIVG